ncbi:MAG: hypothetical protein WBB01_26640 [Phormidesmis sp.]
MVEVTPMGPDGGSCWQETPLSSGSPPAAIFTLPDAANDARVAAGQPEIVYALPDAPLLVHRANGDPVFSLTLLLSRQPRPDEDSVYPLIERGILGFDVSLGVPTDLLPPPRQLRQCTGTGSDMDSGMDSDTGAATESYPSDNPSENPVEYKRLFIRQATIALTVGQAESAQVLTSMQASGTEGRAALSATLERSETLNVLAALAGQTSPLELRAEVGYRVAAAAQKVRLYGLWAAIYDVLETYADAQGELSLTQLKQAVADMLDAQVLSVFRADEPTAEPAANVDRDALFEMFMRLSAVILSRRSPPTSPTSAEASSPEARYGLRGRPHESFALNYTQTLSGASQQSRVLSAPLAEVIGQALAERDWDQFVHLVSSGQAAGGGVEPVPHRVKTRSDQPSRTSRRGSKPLQLAAIKGSIQSVTSTIRPVVKPTVVATKPIFIHQPVSELKPQPIQHGVLDDVILELPHRQPVRSLPVVTNRLAPIWRDRKGLGQYWYAPVFEVVQPAASHSPDSSPFLFEYERTGVTAAGAPALQATIRFTLRAEMSTQTKAAAGKLQLPTDRAVPTENLSVLPQGGFHSNPSALKMVPTDNLSILLQVPFVDDRTGQVKTHPFKATLQKKGDKLIATVKLINEWVRLCYGAIAKAEFQEIPLKLSAAYTFEAYVPVRQQDFEIAFGGKALQTQVVYSAADADQLTGYAYLDAKALTYRLPDSEIRFQREARRLPDSDARSVSERSATAVIGADKRDFSQHGATLITARPSFSVLPQTSIRPVAPKPQLTARPSIASLLPQVQYATRTQVRRESHDVLYPCNTLGNLYREKLGTTSAAIGCRDALQLGQTHYRQYEEIAELRDPQYSVYRSLSQPGQFLVVPLQYCITRQSASVPDAYRPLIILYASIDPDNPVNNWLTLDVTLQPDLPPYMRRALLARLASYDPAPAIQYPTEIPVEQIEYDWSLGSREIVVSNRPIGPFVQVSMEMDPVTWQLQLARLEATGIHGSMRLTLPDGSTLHASLLLQLTQIGGPWDTGPIEIGRAGDRLRLTNKIERPIDISDLVAYQGSGVASTVPLEISLLPDATESVIAPPAADIYPRYRLPPADPTTIREIRSFVEDIHRNFVFMNLISFDNHQLIRLEIQARIKDVVGVYTAQVTEDMPIAEIEVTLPLTTYLESHVLQFRVTKVFSAGTPSAPTTPWLDLNFDTNGNVVSLTWPLIE